MFKKSIKSILAAAIFATGAAVSTTSTANAGGKFGVYIGSGNGNGIHYSQHKKRKHYRATKRGHHRACAPRRALNKAYRIGVNRPHIARINHKRIVVVGYNYGHPAKVVFKRKGHGCKIIRTRGLR